MKSNEKDPYNFEKTGGFIREYNVKTNGKKEHKGKIYQKSQYNKADTTNEGRG